MPPPLIPLQNSDAAASDPEAVEKQYVHDVYNSIAPHFSQTRYKPWPIIATFLESQAIGSIGVDLGTGNGKYLPINNDGSIRTLGLDRSINLLQLARSNGEDVVCGDVLDLCWRAGSFDYAISIATIHHLSTPARRLESVQTLLRALNPTSGRALIYVWAFEQDNLSKRVVEAQDSLVPWVTPSSVVFERYYHFFGKGELEQLVRTAAEELSFHVGPPESGGGRGLEVVQSGWERSNYYVEVKLWTSPNV